MTVHLSCFWKPLPHATHELYFAVCDQTVCTLRMNSKSTKWLIYMAGMAEPGRLDASLTNYDSALGEAACGMEKQGRPHLFSLRSVPNSRCSLCIAFTPQGQIPRARRLTIRVPRSTWPRLSQWNGYFALPPEEAARARRCLSKSLSNCARLMRRSRPLRPVG